MPREHPLASVERELKVAPQHRLDLIEEVEADVRALQAELVRRGHGPGPARRAALRRLVPASAALEELEARHTPRLGRWTRASGPIDRIFMLAVAAVATVVGVQAVFALPGLVPLGTANFLVWPQAIVIGLLAANLAHAVTRLWLHGDLRTPRRRALWARQAGLIVAAVAIGTLGAAWEGYLAVIAPASAGWEAVGRIASFAATGVATAIFGLFGWLAITPRLISDEEMERRITRFFAQARPAPAPPGVTPETEGGPR